ncbi:alpha/beta hydrolase-fold protein, partial [Ruminococcus sp.]|uniref:alpha/beta hydrolase-fold protein n=1 Tax=Ruminococcus sp. TaxID=41978 RepID=UPI002BBFCBF9
VNSDSIINSMDMIAARKLILSSNKAADLVKLADVDRSTEFEVNDLVLLQQYIMGKIQEFPDNTPEPPPSNFNYEENKRYVPAPDSPGNSYFDSCSQQGKVTKETYNGIRGNKTLYVYTPYNYDPSKKYNIFYLMHGGSENENTLFFQNDTMIQNMLDHMIMNGELEPLIVVTPTFNGNGSSAQNFYEELRQSVIPFVESKYSTYAENTTAEGMKASRMHRAYSGFSMGAVSTWAVFKNDLDIVGYFMPLSGDHWGPNSADGKAQDLADAVHKFGFTPRQYFIFAATGTKDMAQPNIGPQIEAMKKLDEFRFTSDFSKGNFYYFEAQGNDHWWGHVRHYVYNALPYFFHESGQ